MTNTLKPPATFRQDSREFYHLQKRLHGNTAPAESDVARYRQLALKHPAFLTCVKESSALLREVMLGKITDGNSKARILAEEDALKRDMDYVMATPLERLLIDHILTTRLHLIHAEGLFNEKIAGAVTFAASNYWQNFLAAAQRRHLRAIETLARVRRLARNGPLFQVNIATAGSRQINAQGELFDLNSGHATGDGSHNPTQTARRLAN